MEWLNEVDNVAFYLLTLVSETSVGEKVFAILPNLLFACYI